MFRASGARYKFFWDGNSSVGIFVSEKWIGKVVEVKRMSTRLVLVKMVIGEHIVNVISAYAPFE